MNTSMSLHSFARRSSQLVLSRERAAELRGVFVLPSVPLLSLPLHIPL